MGIIKTTGELFIMYGDYKLNSLLVYSFII